MTHLTVHPPIWHALGHGDAPSVRGFAIDEIAWMREEAVSIARRMDARAISDVHRLDAGFACLAAHPRVVGAAAQALGSHAVLVGSVLRFADARAPAAVARHCVRVVVDLGPSPDAMSPRSGFQGLGDIRVQDSRSDLDGFDGQLIVALDFERDAGREHSRPANADDVLWPQAAVCAG